MSLGYLNTVLELTLNALVSLSVPATSVPVLDVAENLENDHEIKKDITSQVMSWFGEFSDPVINADTVWKMDAPVVIKQIGLGTLANYKVYLNFLSCNFHVSIYKMSGFSNFKDRISQKMEGNSRRYF